MTVVAPSRLSVSVMAPRFRPSALTRKMPMPPMPSSGLRMTSRCSAWKARIGRGAARHERGRDELRELEDGELLGVVAQRRGAVEHACTLALGLPEQVRGVEVFAVEGRVLAHDHRAGIAQGAGGVLGRDLEPGLPVVFPAGEHDLPGPRR
jgi:hypothetical protein